MRLDPDVRRVLDGTSIAHLATVLPGGSPHTVPLWIGAHGDRIVFLTGPGSRKARNLRRDPRVALSIAPADNPFEPVVIRGRVTEWIEGDAAWEIIDQLAAKYTGQPYSRGQERVVAVIEPERQTVGIG
ncbi:MAG: PPOX class F420-dependent oxidoreductase [Streptosporangiaceae bacterium]